VANKALETCDLPGGPRRNLTAALYKLYIQAGKPSLKVIAEKSRQSNDLIDAVDTKTVSGLIKGTIENPKWAKVQALVWVLVDLGESQRDYCAISSEIFELLSTDTHPKKTQHHNVSNETVAEDSYLSNRFLDMSAYLANMTYEWGRDIKSHRPDYMQGVLCIYGSREGVHRFFPTIFSSEFQHTVTWLPESAYLRQAEASFRTETSKTFYSFRVYGNIVRGEDIVSFISIEVHMNGSVSILFREYTSLCTLDEMLGWWLYGAIKLALEIQRRLICPDRINATFLFSGLRSSPDYPESGEIEFEFTDTEIINTNKHPHYWAQDNTELILPKVRSEFLERTDSRIHTANRQHESEWSLNLIQESMFHVRREDKKRGV
jgi:hypothetical protein